MIGNVADVITTIGFALAVLSAPWVVFGLVPPSDRPTMYGELGDVCRTYLRRWVWALGVGAALLASGGLLSLFA